MKRSALTWRPLSKFLAVIVVQEFVSNLGLPEGGGPKLYTLYWYWCIYLLLW